MKKHALRCGMMMLPMLLSVVTLLMTACSNDGEEEELPGTIIPQVTCDKETIAFFESEWPVYNMPYPETFFERDLWPQENIWLINSEEEFQSIYNGALQLPEIDFSLYTLVMGQKRIECSLGKKSSTELQKIELRDTPEGYHLYLYCDSDVPDAVLYEDLFYYYWAVYPKLNNKSIEVSLKY